MRRSCVLFVALGVALCVSAAGTGATQAGEPIALNVEYDVPVYGAADAAVRVQRGIDLEGKLGAKSSLHAVVGSDPSRDLPFSALAAERGGGGSHDTEVTVHVPSPTAAASASLADFKADAAVLKQLAQAQDLQEQRFLAEVKRAATHLRSKGGV